MRVFTEHCSGHRVLQGSTIKYFTHKRLFKSLKEFQSNSIQWNQYASCRSIHLLYRCGFYNLSLKCMFFYTRSKLVWYQFILEDIPFWHWQRFVIADLLPGLVMTVFNGPDRAIIFICFITARDALNAYPVDPPALLQYLYPSRKSLWLQLW